MTRILAVADTHIREDRLSDIEAVLDEAVTVAVDRGVSLIVHGGDVFHRTRPSPPELHVFQRFTRKLAAAGIPMIVIHGNGNHEAAGDDLSAVELFDDRLVRVSRRPERITEFAGVQVCTLPAVSVARWVASQGKRSDVTSLEMAENLLAIAAGLRLDCDAGAPTLLVGHWGVAGGSLPSGLGVDTLHEPLLEVGAVERLGFDAAVFGHIHTAEILNLGPTPPVVSLGSPLCQDFGEAAGQHGCWIIGLGEELFSAEFVPLAGRRFVTVDVDLTASEAFSLAQTGEFDETDCVAAAIAEQLPLTDAVVRIRYTATEEQHRRVDHNALRGFAAEAGAHKVLTPVPNIIRGSRARAAGVTEALAPVEALTAWATTVRDMSKTRTDELAARLARRLERVAG